MPSHPLFYIPDAPLENEFARKVRKLGWVTENPQMADYILLPFSYEVVHDYSPEEYKQYGIDIKLLPVLKDVLTQADMLSVSLNRPLIVFFYRDPEMELPLSNAIIFRTSGNRFSGRLNENGLPAFVDHFPGLTVLEDRVKGVKPKVSFRGQCMPLTVTPKQRMRMLANTLLKKIGASSQINIYYNKGYQLRRAAILSVEKHKDKMDKDFVLNRINGEQVAYLEGYQQSLRDNDYFICARGHGNYSFRLYEVMRAGRIPVWIDTNALLPAEDKIDWNQIGIRVSEKEVNYTGEKILDFHASIHPDDFLALQQTIHSTWRQWLTIEGFNNYLLTHFLPERLKANASINIH